MDAVTAVSGSGPAYVFTSETISVAGSRRVCLSLWQKARATVGAGALIAAVHRLKFCAKM